MVPSGNPKELKTRIEAGPVVDHSAFTFTPLHWAALHGDTEMVLALISAGADVSVKTAGRIPLELAQQSGHVETAEAISTYIERQQRDWRHIENERMKRLFRAVEFEDVELLRELISHGANTNVRNGDGETLLNFAVSRAGPDHMAVMLELIACGTDVNAGDHSGQAPVHLAAFDMSSTRSLHELISVGANVNLWDNAFNTPLHSAASCNKEAVVMLLENGAVVDARKSIGSTPLHQAAFCGEAESVAALISKGADVNAMNMWGKLRSMGPQAGVIWRPY